MEAIPLKHLTKVYIIESPTSDEISKGINEGAGLSKAFASSGIDHKLYNVADVSGLRSAIEEITTDVSQIKFRLAAVTIHISMHGNDEGIGLTSGDFVTWKDLAELLRILFAKAFIPREVYGIRLCPLTLCFSTCHGLSAERINDYTTEDESLFQYIVGPVEAVTWANAEKAFVEFHRHTLDGKGSSKEAVRIMNTVAHLDNVFQARFGKGLKYADEEG